jgi:hypothetical protein
LQTISPVASVPIVFARLLVNLNDAEPGKSELHGRIIAILEQSQ